MTTHYLGDTAADYSHARLAEAMLHSDYPLQALLYVVMLHRFLRWRVSGYDPARHLGGVLYLFHDEADLRVGWHVTPAIEVSVTGQNLLHDQHLEEVRLEPHGEDTNCRPMSTATPRRRIGPTAASPAPDRPRTSRAARPGAVCASMVSSRSWISAMRCASVACSASSIRRARSTSAASTVSNGLFGPAGASCAT